MGLLSRALGGRSGGAAITRTIVDAVRVLPGVIDQDLTYHHEPRAGGRATAKVAGASTGVISGIVDVTDTPTFLEVLRTVRRILDPLLGEGAERVSFQITGRTLDGAPVQPGDLGLSQPPSGREIRQRLLEH